MHIFSRPGSYWVGTGSYEISNEEDPRSSKSLKLERDFEAGYDAFQVDSTKATGIIRSGTGLSLVRGCLRRIWKAKTKNGFDGTHGPRNIDIGELISRRYKSQMRSLVLNIVAGLSGGGAR